MVHLGTYYDSVHWQWLEVIVYMLSLMVIRTLPTRLVTKLADFSRSFSVLLSA